MAFTKDVLALDTERETARICEWLRKQVRGELRRKGLVLGLSGGIDSSVVAGLAVRALGPEAVLGLLMPERDSEDESLELGHQVAAALAIEAMVENVGPSLSALGCYRRQQEAIRRVEPAYADGWKCKLTLSTILESDRLNVFSLTVQSPQGETTTHRLNRSAYLQLVAATNFKQRVRKTMEYYHADRLHYAVAGTPNLLEYDQGFFVKQGDGAADVKPIAHLYKSQVYALAELLGIPAEIRRRPPTTDTYSLPQTQEEFFFALPYHLMDLCLFGFNHAVPAVEVAPVVDLSPEQVERVYRDIAAKRRATRYLHLSSLTLEPIHEE